MDKTDKFSPFSINGKLAKNRFISSATNSHLCNTDGTVIHIPANVKHWHGAAKDSWFSHLAFEISGEDTANEWLEPVSHEEYFKLK